LAFYLQVLPLFFKKIDIPKKNTILSMNTTINQSQFLLVLAHEANNI